MPRLVSLALFLILLTALISCEKKETKNKPNVILILTDDQGYGDVGIHQNPDIKTPVLDLLARESAKFDRFYVSPLCAPTRASLLTGRYHLSTGTVSVSNGMETMDAEEYTLGELFQDNGYHTGIFGKWHNGQHYPHHPLAQGFDEFTGFLAGHWSNYFDTQLEKDGESQSFPGYLPDVLTDEILEFIDKNRDQPFFAYLAFNTPHSPHQVPDEFYSPYKMTGLEDELAAVYGMVSNIDHNIGRILEKLELLDLDENTVVIFLTDNGPNGNRFNAGMKGIKGSVHEGGVRVPSFWKWPGTIVPSIIHTPAAHIDILPTLAELLSLTVNGERSLDGISLAASLKGEPQNVSRAIYSHVAFSQGEFGPFPGAIRRDSLLLALLHSGFELYNLKDDPNQTENLASQAPETVDKLSKEYLTWFQKVAPPNLADRPIPVTSQSPEIFLPAYEAKFTGEIRFFEGHGWAQDWLTNWKGESDSIFWKVNVLDSGEFEVFLEYTASEDQVGAKMKLTHGASHLEWILSEAFYPKSISSPDRVPRKEAPEQTWGLISIGKIQLGPGLQEFRVTASDIPQVGLGDIYSIRLRPVEAGEK
ncbi:arylsulfatase [Algoriphagus litoralis]|uniref:arylsulfatase n=1 Tax=Algoriphagus litoralis TaxID=2202829 RepID=UPI000DBA6C40|nr:arylsulfatase [Algoriphagus litoralis]